MAERYLPRRRATTGLGQRASCLSILGGRGRPPIFAMCHFPPIEALFTTRAVRQFSSDRVAIDAGSEHVFHRSDGGTQLRGTPVTRKTPRFSYTRSDPYVLRSAQSQKDFHLLTVSATGPVENRWKTC